MTALTTFDHGNAEHHSLLNSLPYNFLIASQSACYNIWKSKIDTVKYSTGEEMLEGMRTRKSRLLTLLLICVLLMTYIGQALAHIPCRCNNPPDKCTCFIQLGDKGLAVEKIIKLLQKKKYLAKPKKKKEFTQDVKKAVIKFQKDHNLECTGWMDDETLDLLLSDELPDSSRQFELERWSDIVFVPTDGGIRYHTNPNCSGMKSPRMITRVNAEKLGIEHCHKSNSCPYASSFNISAYSSLGLAPRILPDSYYITEDKSQASAVPETRSLHTDNKESVYIGNKKSHVFHSPSCSYVNRMSDKNKIEFTSRDEAISNGYEPCSKCNP